MFRAVFFHIILIMLGLQFSISYGKCNTSAADPFSNSLPVESVILSTDRTLYIAGEEVFFTAYVQQSAWLDSLDLSKVLYTELITWNGSKISNVKTTISNHDSYGSFSVPEDLISGVYYVRSYTKWMRNFPPEFYSITPVVVINPFSNESVKGPQGSDSNDTRLENNPIPAQKLSITPGLNKQYRKRQLIEFSIQSDSIIIPGDYSISVVMSGSYLPMNIEISKPDKKQVVSSVSYFPEYRGLTISGMILDSKKEIACPGSVYLSTIQDPEYLSAFEADSAGQFFFTLPHLNGKRNFVISYENKDSIETQIAIDPEFCNTPVSLPYIPLDLSKYDKSEILEMAKNVLLNKSQKITIDTSNVSIDREFSFYGIPSRIIHEKDFIELNNFEEFVYELLYEVSVKEQNGRKGIYSNAISAFSSYPVLVLMDNIPVFDLDGLLELPCRKINRIEIVNSAYVIGETMFGGILSIFSENNDLAGLSLQEQSKKFSFALPAPERMNFPDYSESDALWSHIPDRRNTLYWEPHISILQDEPVTIRFYTSNAPGNYSIILKRKDYIRSSEALILGSFTVE